METELAPYRAVWSIQNVNVFAPVNDHIRHINVIK